MCVGVCVRVTRLPVSQTFDGLDFKNNSPYFYFLYLFFIFLNLVTFLKPVFTPQLLQDGLSINHTCPRIFFFVPLQMTKDDLTEK